MELCVPEHGYVHFSGLVHRGQRYQIHLEQELHVIVYHFMCTRGSEFWSSKRTMLVSNH